MIFFKNIFRKARGLMNEPQFPDPIEKTNGPDAAKDLLTVPENGPPSSCRYRETKNPAGKQPTKKPPVPHKIRTKTAVSAVPPAFPEKSPGTYGRITASGRPRLLKQIVRRGRSRVNFDSPFREKAFSRRPFLSFRNFEELTLPVSASDSIGYQPYYHKKAFFSSFFSP